MPTTKIEDAKAPVKAAEAVKTEVKTEAKAAVAPKAPAAKSQPAKEQPKEQPAAKKAPAKKAAAKKPAAKKEAPKAAAKKEAPKAAAKKAPAKKAAKKPAKKAAAKKIVEPKKFIIQNTADQGIAYTDVVKKVNKAYKDTIKTLEIYVKSEENKAYYVINGTVTGSVDLF